MCLPAVWGWYVLTAYLAVLAADASWGALQLTRPALNPAWAAAKLDEKQVGPLRDAGPVPAFLHACVVHMYATRPWMRCMQPYVRQGQLGVPIYAPGGRQMCKQLQCPSATFQAALWGLPATAAATPPRAAGAGQPQQQRQVQQQRQFQAVTPLASLC